jgi:NhaP-type Na+/H+ or K+/H+ antiporter
MGRMKKWIFLLLAKPSIIILSFGFVMGYLAHDFIKRMDKKIKNWRYK